MAFALTGNDRLRPEKGGSIVRDELSCMLHWEDRHRRLPARVLLAIALDPARARRGIVLVWLFESGKSGSDVHGFGDAVFFTLVQVLTVSSSLRNPVTSAGRVVGVMLEAWAIFVVTTIAGSFSAFFSSGDAGSLRTEPSNSVAALFEYPFSSRLSEVTIQAFV